MPHVGRPREDDAAIADGALVDVCHFVTNNSPGVADLRADVAEFAGATKRTSKKCWKCLCWVNGDWTARAAPTITGSFPMPQEINMLSPHEFATLLLLEGAPDSVDLNSEDLAVLIERQLVALERLASGCQRLQLTVSAQKPTSGTQRSDRAGYVH